MRRYFDSSNVRGEGNSVIFISREILPGPEDAPIYFTIVNDNEGFYWNSKTYSIDNEYLLNTDVFCDLFYFGELTSTMGGIGALRAWIIIII